MSYTSGGVSSSSLLSSDSEKFATEMSSRLDPLHRAQEHRLPQLPRDLKAAREAFQRKDLEASRVAHAGLLAPGPLSPEDLAVYFGDTHEEPHIATSGDVVKALVFGGLDGVVTIFAIVAGCVGARITPGQVIIVGIGNLLADAFSMGFGEYISAKAELEFVNAEKVREQWEIDNCPEGEKGEMVDIYQTKYGITYEDAVAMIDIAFKYPKFFLAHMMVEELGLQLEDSNGPSPAMRGLVMFCSFGVFGMIPLLGFTLWLAGSKNSNVHSAFLVTCAVTLLTLFILGLFKARFSNQNPFKSGFVMMINGAVASVAAYGSGAVLQNMLGQWGYTASSFSAL